MELDIPKELKPKHYNCSGWDIAQALFALLIIPRVAANLKALDSEIW